MLVTRLDEIERRLGGEADRAECSPPVPSVAKADLSQTLIRVGDEVRILPAPLALILLLPTAEFALALRRVGGVLAILAQYHQSGIYNALLSG